MQAGDPDVGDLGRGQAVGGEHGAALAGDRAVRRSRRHQGHPLGSLGGRVPHDRRRLAGVGDAVGLGGEGGGGLVGLRPGEHDRAGATVGPQRGDDGGTLLRRLARGVDGLGHALTQGPVVVDLGEAEIGVREAPKTAHGVVGSDRAAPHAVQQLSEVGFLHVTILPV